jgi:hypothetical protein
MQCDNSINEACELLGSFELIEEVINSIFGESSAVAPDRACPDPLRHLAVFVIRFAERKIDQLLDATILDYSLLPSEFEGVQFESEWSFLRALGGKKRGVSNANSPRRNGASSPTTPARSPSPSIHLAPHSPSKSFSFRQTLSRARPAPSIASLHLFPDPPPPPSPADLTSFLTALHKLLILSDINPALVAQLWSQVLYWTSCKRLHCILEHISLVS